MRRHRALAAARDEGRPFDLVVMDLTVRGGMGGLPALQALRAVDPGIRAVVSSGYSSNPVLSRYADHGFVGRLPKPWLPQDLLRVLREALEHDG